MSIYAISDLHLSKSMGNKSMEIFGDKWKNYESKIDMNWRNTVKDTDTVIIPGDISWATTLEEAYKDFQYINSLPGTKIILKGNHDFYFTTVKKINEFLEKNNFNTIKILHNCSYCIEGYNICGTRGWGTIDDIELDDRKIYERELIRARLSLDSIKEENKNKPIIFALHFPPFKYETKKLLAEYKIKTCIYGHLHGDGHNMVVEGLIDNINYKMVSGDYTDFNLIKLN